MQTKIEGLLLTKMPYAERDIIAQVLLRNGKKISCLFHGGRGGGSKKKSSILELGFMLKIELRRSPKKMDFDHQELFHAQEWNLLWHHDKIRLNHQAFYLLCFFQEVIKKMSINDDLFQEHRESDETSIGLFKVLSNALFFMEDELQKSNELKKSRQLIFFLTKLLVELGVYPDREVCHACFQPLALVSSMQLAPHEGGFICQNCLAESALSSGKELWDILGLVASTPYRDYAKIEGPSMNLARILFDYLCFQFQISDKDFLSSSMVF